MEKEKYLQVKLTLFQTDEISTLKEIFCTDVVLFVQKAIEIGLNDYAVEPTLKGSDVIDHSKTSLFTNGQNAYVYVSLPKITFKRLVRTAKILNVTVNGLISYFITSYIINIFGIDDENSENNTQKHLLTNSVS